MLKKKFDIQAEQGTKIIFILPLMVFSIFVIFLTNDLATSSSVDSQGLVIGNSSSNFSNPFTQSGVAGGNLRPPICDLSGWGILTNIFGLKCVADQVGFFIGLSFISSEYLLLNIIVFLPLGIGMSWAILELIRGV